MVEAKYNSQHIRDTDMKEEDPELVFNKEFVAKFSELKTYEEGAIFIADWIKIQLHNPTEFTNDLPALLQYACEQRKQASTNPETKENIFSLCNGGTESDCMVSFSLSLLEACSTNELVPAIICRIILNTLYLEIQDEKIVLTAEHQELAISKIQSVRPDLITDYINKLKLQLKVDENFFKELAQSHISNNKYHEAALIIYKFKFISDFDCAFLIDKLLEQNRVPATKQLGELDSQLRVSLIKKLSTAENHKVASQLLKEFRLDIRNFPELQQIILQTKMTFLSRRIYKKANFKDHLRIEDLCSGNSLLLGYLVDDLVQDGKLNEAVGICIRHNLISTIREESRLKLEGLIYDSGLEKPLFDVFGPLSEGKYLTLPQTMKVNWIQHPQDIEKLDVLLSEKFIGIDSEWKPQFSKSSKTGIAILQISGQNESFLIDMISLKDSSTLDNKLSLIFSDDKSIKIGFSFGNDIEQFAWKLPRMKFYKYIKNFIDAQTYYSNVQSAAPQSGLAKVCDKVFSIKLCKQECISNWERRPLRLSQQHYAALDAYILIELIQILSEQGAKQGRDLQKHLRILDNRYIKELNDDDFESDEEGKIIRKAEQAPQQQNSNNKNQKGNQRSDKNVEDFIPGKLLTPQMKKQGFIVENFLFQLGKSIQNKGYYCRIAYKQMKTDEVCQQAIKENRVFLTNNIHVFKGNNDMNIGYVQQKINAFNQFKAVDQFFQF